MRRLSQEAMKKEWEMYRKELTTDYKRRKKAALNLLKKSQKNLEDEREKKTREEDI